MSRHGSLFAEVLEPARKTPDLAAPIAPELPYLKAEILYSVTHEGARSVADVLLRRTRINFEMRDQGLSIVEQVAELVAPILGWSENQRRASVAEYRKIVSDQESAIHELSREREEISS